MARADQLHDSPSLGRGVRLRPAARVRFRQRPDDDGVAAGEIPLALLLFNVGVEIGQVGFVLLIVLLLGAFVTSQIRWPRAVEALPGYAVGSLGAYWTIQRTLILIGGPSMTARRPRRVAAIAVLLWLARGAAGRRASAGRAGRGLPVRGAPSGVGPGPRAGDGVGGPLGRATRPPALWLLPVIFPMVMAFGGFLGLAGCRCRASRSASRCRPSSSASWSRGGAAAARGRGGARRLLRDLPRARAWHRASARRAASPTASASSRPPAACTAWASPWVSCTHRPAGRVAQGGGCRGGRRRCGVPVEGRVRDRVHGRRPRAGTGLVASPSFRGRRPPKRTSSRRGSGPCTTASRTC